jgi:hypothetical protein
VVSMVSSPLSDFCKYFSGSFLYSHVVNIYFTMSSVIFYIFLFLSLQWLQLGVTVSCSPYSDHYHTWLQT